MSNLNLFDGCPIHTPYSRGRVHHFFEDRHGELVDDWNGIIDKRGCLRPEYYVLRNGSMVRFPVATTRCGLDQLFDGSSAGQPRSAIDAVDISCKPTQTTFGLVIQYPEATHKLVKQAFDTLELDAFLVLSVMCRQGGLMTVSAIACVTQLSDQEVDHQLSALKRADLVRRIHIKGDDPRYYPTDWVKIEQDAARAGGTGTEQLFQRIR